MLDGPLVWLGTGSCPSTQLCLVNESVSKALLDGRSTLSAGDNSPGINGRIICAATKPFDISNLGYLGLTRWSPAGTIAAKSRPIVLPCPGPAVPCLRFRLRLLILRLGRLDAFLGFYKDNCSDLILSLNI